MFASCGTAVTARVRHNVFEVSFVVQKGTNVTQIIPTTHTQPAIR